MLSIAIIDAGCCNPDAAAATQKYARFLEVKFEGRVDVGLYDVEVSEGPNAVPQELYLSLAAQGVDQVPVLAIDGELVSQGELPDWIQSLELIEGRLAQHAETHSG